MESESDRLRKRAEEARKETHRLGKQKSDRGVPAAQPPRPPEAPGGPSPDEETGKPAHAKSEKLGRTPTTRAKKPGMDGPSPDEKTGEPARAKSEKLGRTPTTRAKKPGVDGPSPDEETGEPAHVKSGKLGRTPTTRTKKPGVGGPTRSRGGVKASSPGQAEPNRALLVVGVVAAVAAMGGAVFFATSGGKDNPTTAPPTSEPVKKPPVTTPNGAPSSGGSKGPVASVTPLDRAKVIVEAARATEAGKRENEAVLALDGALMDGWPTNAKALLSDARAGILDRFRAKIADLKTIVSNGELARARSVIADLKGRCPDVLVPALNDAEGQLDLIARREPTRDPPRDPPRADPPTPPREPPKDPEERRTPVPPDQERPEDKRGAKKDDARKDDARKDDAKKDDARKDDDKGRDDPAVAEKAAKIRDLLLDEEYSEDGRGSAKAKEKLAEAANLVPELMRLGPDSPVARGARGLVLYAQRKYEECQPDLACALSADPEDRRVRRSLAQALFLFGHYEATRALVKDRDERECKRLLYLIDGPWAESNPLAHAALEQRTPNGHYSIVTDLGLELGAVDKLEAELSKAAPEKRASMREKFAQKHGGSKECQRYFEAAYRAFCKLFKIKDADAKTAKAAADAKKNEGKKDNATTGRDTEIKLPVNHGRVVRVYIFGQKSDFAAFSRKIGIGSTEHILGYFMPSSKILAFYREESRENALITKALHEVLFHESFHQFLDLFIADSPPWFNEGLAEYFAYSELTPNGLRYGMIPDGTKGGSRYTNLQEVISPTYQTLYGQTAPKLFALMKMNHSDFMVHGAANYAMSWGLVHYFASSKPGQKKLKAYFRGLRDGTSNEEMFRKVFGEINQPQLEADFRQHVVDMASNRTPPDDDD